jgi:glutathione-regulated potassium-efflux system ancillary protein KefF
MSAAQDIYLLFAHPQIRNSRANSKLLHAAKQIPRVKVRDLYESYPDFIIDVAREQEALLAARLVVMVHPVHWYSMPALQKLWVDEVLTLGWAYGKEGNQLHGKDLWLALSTGGPETSYREDGINRRSFDAFLPPYEQTANLCGMRFVPPLIIHGAIAAQDEALNAHAAHFAAQLAAYPNW